MAKIIVSLKSQLDKQWQEANEEKNLERARQLREKALQTYRLLKKQEQLLQGVI